MDWRLTSSSIRVVLQHNDALLEERVALSSGLKAIQLLLLRVEFLEDELLVLLDPQRVALRPNADFLDPGSWPWRDRVVR